MAREISESDREVGRAIWELARTKFPTKGAFARQLNVTPQYLHAYLSGTNRPGIIFLKKLVDLGLDVSGLPGAEEARPFITPTPAIHGFASALADALDVMDRTPITLARSLGVDVSRVEGWLQGDGQPSYEELGRLFTMTAESSIRKPDAGVASPPAARPHSSRKKIA